MAGREQRTTRRDLLRIGAILGVAAIVMAQPWRRFMSPDLAFEPLPGLAPMRRLAGRGEASGGSATGAVFAGLEAPDEPSEADLAARARVETTLCSELGLPWQVDAPLPVTYFTDINCPSCRALEATLARLEGEAGAEFAVMTREFPVFGPRSEAAARAVIAASAQGADDAMRAHLRRRPLPSDPSGLASLAVTLGLDADAFLSALSSPATEMRLATDHALARHLALPGTPGLVVGRTVVIGAQPRDVLRALIEREMEEGPPPDCA